MCKCRYLPKSAGSLVCRFPWQKFIPFTVVRRLWRRNWNLAWSAIAYGLQGRICILHIITHIFLCLVQGIWIAIIWITSEQKFTIQIPIVHIEKMRILLNKQWLHCRKWQFLIAYMVHSRPSWFLILVIANSLYSSFSFDASYCYL